MELNNRKPALPGADRLPKSDLKPDLTRKLREATPKAREQVEAASETRKGAMEEQLERTRNAASRQGSDRIELSAAARALAENGEAGELRPAESRSSETTKTTARTASEPAPERAARISKLMEQIDAGTLHSPERIERAAAALLGDVANPA